MRMTLFNSFQFILHESRQIQLLSFSACFGNNKKRIIHTFYFIFLHLLLTNKYIAISLSSLKSSVLRNLGVMITLQTSIKRNLLRVNRPESASESKKTLQSDFSGSCFRPIGLQLFSHGTRGRPVRQGSYQMLLVQSSTVPDTPCFSGQAEKKGKKKKREKNVRKVRSVYRRRRTWGRTQFFGAASRTPLTSALGTLHHPSNFVFKRPNFGFRQTDGRTDGRTDGQTQ